MVYRTWYKCEIGERFSSKKHSFKILVSSEKNIIDECFNHLKPVIFDRLIENYKGSKDDVHEIKIYLTRMELKNAVSEKFWKAQTQEELLDSLHIENYHSRFVNLSIKQTHGCEGCEFDSCGQRNHMECPYGCLHDRENCEICCKKKNK